MAFGNPIIGGQGVLIREAIKSPNYVPGVSGWTINRDGSAEFNDVTVRGRLEVTGVGNSFIRIDTEAGIPTIALQPDWSGLSEELFFGSVVSAEDTVLDEGTIIFYGPGFAGQTRARIIWGASTTLDCYLTVDGAELLTLAGTLIQMTGAVDLQGAFTASGLITASGDLQVNGDASVSGDITVGTATDILDTNGDDRYGRGRVNLALNSANTNLNTGSETITWTWPSIQYAANRAYSVKTITRYVGTGGPNGNPTTFLRKGTTTAGAVVVDGGRIPIPVTNTLTYTWEGIFQTASAVTTALCIGQTAAVGTPVVAAPGYGIITDIGPASDFSNAPTLT